MDTQQIDKVLILVLAYLPLVSACVLGTPIYEHNVNQVYVLSASIGVIGTNLDGTRLRSYPLVFKAYPQKKVGSVEKFIMDHIISNIV